MRALVLLACSGCSTLLGIDDLHVGGDAGTQADAVDATVANQIILEGTVRQLQAQGGMNGVVKGANVTLVSTTDQTTTQTSANDLGLYTIPYDTHGRPLDGFVTSADPSGAFEPSQTYFEHPLISDAIPFDLVELDKPSLDMLGQLCAGAGTQTVVVVEAVAMGMPVANATVESEPPGSYCSSKMGNPQPGNITGSDGIVFVFAPIGAGAHLTVIVNALRRDIMPQPGMAAVFVPVSTTSD